MFRTCADSENIFQTQKTSSCLCGDYKNKIVKAGLTKQAKDIAEAKILANRKIALEELHEYLVLTCDYPENIEYRKVRDFCNNHKQNNKKKIMENKKYNLVHLI